MTWHLKDRELEKRLIGRYPDFLISLNDDAFSKSGLGFVFSIILWRKINCKNYYDVMTFCTDELEEVAEYNPHAWNEYPKVTPPFDKDMRVELDDGLRYCARYHKFSDGCFWVGTNGTCFPKYLNDKVVRFRPWED